MPGVLIAVVVMVLVMFALPIYAVLADRRLAARPRPAAPALPVEFTADRWLAALYGLPLVAASMMMLIMPVLDSSGFREYPGIVSLSLCCGALLGWLGWFVGHNLFWTDRLLLTQEGITLSTPGRRRFWRWDNIDRVYTAAANPVGSEVAIVLKADDPARLRWMRWKILRDARTISLGKMWKAPFGMPGSVMVCDIIRAVLADRVKRQPMMAQLSG